MRLYEKRGGMLEINTVEERMLKRGEGSNVEKLLDNKSRCSVCMFILPYERSLLLSTAILLSKAEYL